jgi:hypothetical protein
MDGLYLLTASIAIVQDANLSKTYTGFRFWSSLQNDFMMGKSEEYNSNQQQGYVNGLQIWQLQQGDNISLEIDNGYLNTAQNLVAGIASSQMAITRLA